MTRTWKIKVKPPVHITTVEEAKAEGYTRYWSGKPCVYGHDSGLRNLSKQCVECRADIQYRARRKAKGLKPVPDEPKKIPKRQKPKGKEARTKKSVWEWRKKYVFRRKKANRIVNFFERRLVHIEGQLAGQPIVLEQWERRILRRLFGWFRRDDGSRKHRTLYLEVPRKNGKSILASGIALYLLYCDEEPASRVVAAAADEEQALQVFGVAKEMVKQSVKLERRLTCYKRTIVDLTSASQFKILSSRAHTKHGKNLHGIVLDEVHVLPNRELYDALHTGVSARRQPMEVLITTAGWDKNSLCFELHDYAVALNEGVFEDDSFYGVIFAADEEDDWTKEETWYKANPNLGVSKSLEYMRSECVKAQKSPAKENSFKRLELNIWTEQDSRWLPMHVWDQGGEPRFDESLFYGRTVYGGMDLSSTQDVTAVVYVGEDENGELFVIPRFWIPRETARERAKSHRVPYPEWIRQGFIRATEGNRIDYDFIRAEIKEDAERFDLREVQYDRWNATQLAGQLEGDGLEMLPMAQTFENYNEPCLELERRVTKGNVKHAGHPVLRWMARNVQVLQNGEGKIRPSKKKSPEKIDGITALLMGLDRLMRHHETESVYEERGMVSV